MTVGYAITFALAMGLLAAYLILVKDKSFWLTMLYVCVAIVNLGYLLISVSKTVGFAIFANDLAYLGSVFLSACMFLTILELCGFKVTKAHAIICTVLATLMFGIVVTTGILPVFYESVELEFLQGGTKLIKEYGVLHPSNLVYLVSYIIAMIVVIIRSIRLNKRGSHKFAGLIAGIVCMNVAVWGVQKFVEWDFEALSVTYIISELMLVFVYWMMQDYVHKNDIPDPVINERQTVVVVDTLSKADKIKTLLDILPGDKSLTAKEIEILGEVVEGKTRRDIASIHHISENTVKTHVTHIYEKFGVSSKDALLALIHKN